MNRFSFYRIRKVPLEELAEKASSDKKAFEELFRRMADAAYAYFYAKTSDRELAEDLTQELFLRLYQKLSGYRKTGTSFKAWFFRVARNIYIDRMRKDKNRQLSLENTRVNVPADTGSREDAIAVEQALSKLDELDREIIILYFYQGLKNDEIARVLKLSPENVRVRKHRALKKLASLMVSRDV